MHHWQITDEEKQQLSLIQSMILDCVMGRGVPNKETFIANIGVICNGMLPEDSPLRLVQSGQIQECEQITQAASDLVNAIRSRPVGVGPEVIDKMRALESKLERKD